MREPVRVPTLLLCLTLACSPVAPSTQAPSAPPEPGSARSTADPTPADPPDNAPAPAEVRELGPVERVLDRPVLSLALGRPAVAAILDEPAGPTPWWTGTDGVWRAIALPAALQWSQGSGTDARIHFGRNDKPRILGTRMVDGAPQPLYLRFRGPSWLADREEVAELLAGAADGMYGVLGHADPEVVCKRGATCLIKRQSGWQRMAAAAAAPRVDLQGGRAFAVWPTQVAVLDGLSWKIRSDGAGLVAARGVWGNDAELWISDAAGEGTLWHQSEGAWQSTPSPVGAPDQLWGSGPADLWLAGADGLAHYDGDVWVRVAGVDGPLSEVFGRPGEVWAAGPSGLWRVGWSGPPLPPELVDAPRLIDEQSRPLPQTEARPSATSPAFTRRISLLWDAIVNDDPERASHAFFPLVAYQQVKAIEDPTRDWNQRLLSAFERSIHTYHARLGTAADGATLEGVQLREDGVRWMKPGSEGNHLGYFRVTRAKLLYRTAALPAEAEPLSLEITSLISWRGEWFVVHLDGFE